MLNRFSVLEVPEVHAPEQVEPLLTQMKESGLPVFVMRSAGYSLEDVFGPYAEPFVDAGFVPRVENALELKYIGPNRWLKLFTPRHASGVRDSDIPLHMDSVPNAAGNTISALGLNLVQQGAVEATFFEPTVTFTKDETKDINIGPKGNMHTHFLKGRIDDEILNPNAYQVRLDPLDLVVFRIGGKLPLAHHFRTLEKRRRSLASTAGASKPN